MIITYFDKSKSKSYAIVIHMILLKTINTSNPILKQLFATCGLCIANGLVNTGLIPDKNVFVIMSVS